VVWREMMGVTSEAEVSRADEYREARRDRQGKG
jgi:hypothetical protein